MRTFGTSEPIAPETGPEAIECRAAEWSDALREGGNDPELRRAFERWHDADPAHAEAFTRVDGAYRQALAAGNSRQMVELENEVLAAVAARDRRRGRRYALSAAAVAGLVAVVVTGFAATGGSWQELQYLRDRALHALAGETLYRTGVGERLAVVLEDGSELTLNTDSRAVIDYGEAARSVILARGQALFEVAHDKTRPFEVRAGGRKITALGTAFDVRLSKARLEVTLIEGRVKVEEDAAGAMNEERQAAEGEQRPAREDNGVLPGTSHVSHLTSHVLKPGQQLIVATAGPALPSAPPAEPVIRQADVRRTASWRNGQVIFENDPLAEAVEEINRYGGRRVVLADQDLADLRVSGIFNIGNTTIFVETLTRYFPLYVAAADQNRIVLAERPGG
jgi:transmembrane sensor